MEISKDTNIIGKNKTINNQLYNLQLELNNLNIASFDDLRIKNFNMNKLEKLIALFQYKLDQSGGEFSFELGLENGEMIGVSLDELTVAIENIKKISNKLDLNFEVTNYLKGKHEGIVAEIAIKRNNPQYYDKNEVKIGLFGEEMTGKTTFIGVLSNNTLDNGEGSARQNMFRYSHEVSTGKTISIFHQVNINIVNNR
jgi:GTPase